MEKLEQLKQILEEKEAKSNLALSNIKDGYKKLIMDALKKNNFDTSLVFGVRIEADSQQPGDNSWIRDFIEVCIKGEDDDYYRADIYIKKDSVEFNNCCAGSWTADDLYFQYIKLLAILASELNQSLLEYSQTIDREPLREYDKAYWDFEKEQDRIRAEEHEREMAAKIQEIDNAEYLAQFDYFENKEPRLNHLYKVVRQTPKRIYLEEYHTKQYKGDPEDLYRPSSWYRHEDFFHKEELYSPRWKAVTKDNYNIMDN